MGDIPTSGNAAVFEIWHYIIDSLYSLASGRQVKNIKYKTKEKYKLTNKKDTSV